MDLWALIVAGVAFLFSLFTYFKHDRSLKKQATLININQLEKIKKDKEESKKAYIEAEYIKKVSGDGIIKVYNKGKSTAHSVNVVVPQLKGFEVISSPCPMDIRPMKSFEITLMIFAGHPDKITLEFEWNDDYKEGNRDSQEIQLL